MTFFIDESVIMKEKDNEIQWISSDYSKELYYEIKKIADKYKFKLKIICLGNTDENKNLKKIWCINELKIPIKDIKFIKKRTQKLQFANPESILLDSKMDMINSFVYCGGHSIYCEGSIWTRMLHLLKKALEYDDKIAVEDDSSALIRKKLKFLLHNKESLLDDQYVYRECLNYMLEKTDEYYKNYPKKSRNSEIKIGEKFSSIFSLYEEAKNEKRVKESSCFEFDPVKFLESYGFVEQRTNGEGKKVFDKVYEHFKIHHNINIFDLSEYECKAILLYVFVNLFSNGLSLGVDNSKHYIKIK